ncbi:BcrAD BadFG domain containing protein [Trichuris trichiura]|uniref:N-acetyl-D-glucosamine kinase n=1 Tax=Trichuris trichiura TaxID=36087 RepID=A0A077YYG4_TRITR|nr:BcrAD BadFG domain containing protein [Trichuris trichiura]
MAFLNEEPIFAGVDGGASKTTLVLMNSEGNVLAETVGPGTTTFVKPRSEVYRVFLLLLKSAMEQAGLSPDTKLTSLGLAISGAEHDPQNAAFVAHFQQSNPKIAKHVVLMSDSDGALSTAFDNGGIVLIAGTGSSCRSLSPDGNRYGCGGWGHLIGDDGSAYWIAARAIRKVFTLKEQFETSSGNGQLLAQQMRDHFNLKCDEEILDYLYENFQKAKIASFCKRLSQVNDPVVQQLFADAGRALACHVRAVATRWQVEKFGSDFRLPVLLIGSVWNSFDLMQPGFIDGLRAKDVGESQIKNVDLFKLTVSPAVGACVSAAKVGGYYIPLEKEKCRKLFCALQMDN